MRRALIIGSMLVNILFCQQGWVSLQGPEGGAMRYMLWLPPDYNNIIGCASNGEWFQLEHSEGLYYSRNCGNRWYLCENGIDWSKGGIQQIDYNYLNPDIIYAAQGDLHTGAAYKTTDGGLTWVNIAPIEADFRAIYCSRKDPNVLLIGSRWPGIGIFRSTDGGNSWTNVNSSIRCYEFAYDPKCPDTVYVGGPSSYIWRSVDGGQTWSQITNLPISDIVSVAVDPQNGNIIYCIPDNGTDHYGVYRSSNFGATWQQVLAPPASYVLFVQVRISPVNPNIVWAVGLSGLYRSTNRGLNFTRIATFPGTGWGILPHPAKDSTVIISSGNKLWLTTDLGNTWHDKNFRLHALWAYPKPFNTNLIYALAYGAYYSALVKTTNRGKTWTTLLEKYCNLPYNPGTIYSCSDVHPVDSNCVIVGSRAGVLRTTDGGVTWNSPAGLTKMCDVHFSHANYNHVWAAAIDSGIYKSMNKGSVFVRTNAPYGADKPYVSLALHPADSNIALAGTAKASQYVNAMMIRTSDGGTTWQIVFNAPPSFYNFQDIEFSPSSPTIAYFCETRNVYKSTDEGLTWSLAGSVPDYIYDLEIDPSNPNILYAGTKESGIFQSTDQGASWTSFNFNLPNNEVVFGIKILQAGATSYIYCGDTRGVHVLGSLDTLKPSVSVIQPNGGEVLWSGQSYNILWSASDNLNVDGIDIFYSTDAGSTYQGVSYNELNDGVYSWTVPNTPSNQCYVRIDAYDFAGNMATDRSNNYFTIGQVGINELKGKNLVLNLKGTINPILILHSENPMDIALALYDCTGARVYSLTESNFCGKKEIKFNSLPGGVYFYVLTENGVSHQGKIVVIR
ncbi:MAG: VPS10 domain-containing protein [bacterium]